MKPPVKKRLMGTAILAVISVIVIPLLFDESDPAQTHIEIDLPVPPPTLKASSIVTVDQNEVITPLIDKLPPQLLLPNPRQ